MKNVTFVLSVVDSMLRMREYRILKSAPEKLTTMHAVICGEHGDDGTVPMLGLPSKEQRHRKDILRNSWNHPAWRKSRRVL